MITAAMLLLLGCGVRPAEGYPSGFDFYNPMASDCGHEVKPVVSMELVSQKKPLVFFELLEYPKMEDIKVKLTYEDGSSEVLDAYDLKYCSYSSEWSSGDAGMEHHRGMFITYPGAFTLNPGRQQIAMFYVDLKRAWSTDDGLAFKGYFDSLHPENAGVDYYGFGSLPLEDTDVAYCMVEVYAQTGDEYIAEHNLPFVLVTESSGGDVITQKGEYGMEYGIIKLLAQESGTYLIEAEGGTLYEKYAGNGEFKCDIKKNPDGAYDAAYSAYYARLNANEPLFIKAYSSIHVSIKRVPDGTVAFDE